jgi:hypothetical protein
MASSQKQQLAVLEDFFLETGLVLTDVDYMTGEQGSLNFILRDEKTREEAAWVTIDREGHIIVNHEFVPGIRSALLRSGLSEYMREKPDHVRYRTRYVHKISPRKGDVGADAVLSPARLKDERYVGSTLRDQRILGKGERVREYRVESDGRIVVFPMSGVWHSIILTPA